MRLRPNEARLLLGLGGAVSLRVDRNVVRRAEGEGHSSDASRGSVVVVRTERAVVPEVAGGGAVGAEAVGATELLLLLGEGAPLHRSALARGVNLHRPNATVVSDRSGVGGSDEGGGVG